MANRFRDGFGTFVEFDVPNGLLIESGTLVEVELPNGFFVESEVLGDVVDMAEFEDVDANGLVDG